MTPLQEEVLEKLRAAGARGARRASWMGSKFPANVLRRLVDQGRAFELEVLANGRVGIWFASEFTPRVVRGRVSPELPRVDLRLGPSTYYLRVAVQGSGGVKLGTEEELRQWIERRAAAGDLALLTRSNAEGQEMLTELAGEVELLAFYPASFPERTPAG